MVLRHHTKKAMMFLDKTIEAAIFDMDGTMFDMERLRFRMLKQASGVLYGMEMSDQLLYDSLGVSAVTGERLAKDLYGEEFPYKEIRRMADELERQYIREHGVPVKDGLYNLLERLKKNEVLLALATSSRREIVMEYLIKAKVLRYFDIIVCGDEVEHGKPNPEIFLKAALELSCEPEKCMIVEDSENGLKAAIAAGGIPIFIKDIKDVPEKTKSGVYQSYHRMTEFRDALAGFTEKRKVPGITEPFPQNADYEIAGIHGFGAIGGGYLAQIFSHWDGYTRPQKIIGTTRNPSLMQMVNALGKYRVKYESLAYFETIENIEIIDQNDEDKVIEMYEISEIIGLALPEKAIPGQADMIAKALLNRYRKQLPSLTILIVMNKIHAARYVLRYLEKYLTEYSDRQTAQKILKYNYFVETVVNRMVTTNAEDVIASKLRSDLETLSRTMADYKEDFMEVFDLFSMYSQQDKSDHEQKRKPVSVSGNLATIAHFSREASEIGITLFSAEPDMAIYASEQSPLVKRLCQAVTVSDIGVLQEIKNKLSNGTHAIIAWYSWLLGYKTVGQGMGDTRVEKIAKSIMEKEIRPALIAENPEMKRYIDSFISNFLKRCRLSFKDRCTRVGRDPQRKLQKGERVLGAVELANNVGLSTPGLEFGVACAILYSLKCTEIKDQEARNIRKLYEKKHDITDVLCYDGTYNKGVYCCLNQDLDQELIQRIKNQFEHLKRNLA